MKRSKYLFIIFFALVSVTVAAATQPPEELIKDIFNRVGKENLLLNKDSKAVVDDSVDFSTMALAILADEASKRTPEEVKWFVTTLQEIITRSVYPSAPKFLENVNITFKESQFTDDKVKIASIVKKKGEETQVDYLLKKIGDSWKIIDVSIDDESWVKTLNEKVKRTLREKGWKGLKNLLSKRLNELKSPKKNS